MRGGKCCGSGNCAHNKQGGARNHNKEHGHGHGGVAHNKKEHGHGHQQTDQRQSIHQLLVQQQLTER